MTFHCACANTCKRMGSHIVRTFRSMLCFKAGLMMAAWAAETCSHTCFNFVCAYYWNCCVWTEIYIRFVLSHNGMASIKFIAGQARTIFQYKNTRTKILNFCTSVYFNKKCLMPSTLHIPIHVNVRDPILCAHLGACYVLKLAWWWLYEQRKHVATRVLTLYLLIIGIVVSGRKYT